MPKTKQLRCFLTRHENHDATRCSTSLATSGREIQCSPFPMLGMSNECMGPIRIHALDAYRAPSSPHPPRCGSASGGYALHFSPVVPLGHAKVPCVYRNISMKVFPLCCRPILARHPQERLLTRSEHEASRIGKDISRRCRRGGGARSAEQTHRQTSRQTPRQTPEWTYG